MSKVNTDKKQLTGMKSHDSGVISKLNFVAICIKSLSLITALK